MSNPSPCKENVAPVSIAVKKHRGRGRLPSTPFKLAAKVLSPEREERTLLGKSRKTKIKRLGDEILEHHPDYFTSNFDENKKMVAEVAVIASKKIRNQVAGYITHALNTRAN